MSLHRLHAAKNYESLSVLASSIHKTPQKPWNANTCLQCFASLSERILEEVIKTDPIPTWRSAGADTFRIPEPMVWRIAFKPGQGLSIKKLGASVPGAQDGSSSERWGFLPLKFVKEMLELSGVQEEDSTDV